ncbi:MAG TPA: SH3 domain-containing protein [Thermomicrobiales bacterium]|jgi:uncharacterized protein YgiM (DUF1202 family)|nr:SH3 domain-containing protein [Thermomicrobiales bacterium]
MTGSGAASAGGWRSAAGDRRAERVAADRRGRNILVAPAAAQETPAATSYVTVEALNVRAEPTISGVIIGTLAYGAIVTVVGGPVAADGYTWYQLARDGQTLGWSVNGLAAGAPPDTGGIPAPIDQFKAGDTVTVNANALNVRQSPSTTATVIGTLAYGERVTLTGMGQLVGSDVWYPIAGGWVAGACLTAATVTPPTNPTNPTTPPAIGGFAYGTTVTVTADLLNGRSTPSLSGGIISVFTDGQTLTITGEPRQADGITWYGVNNTAWVSGEYLTAATGGGTTPPTTTPLTGEIYVAIVNTDVLSVRSAPSLSGIIVAVYRAGDTANVTGGAVQADGIDWLPVNGFRGVAGQYLTQAAVGLGDTTVIVNIANIRSAPGTNASIIGAATFGQRAFAYTTRIDSTGREWVMIPDGGDQWITADLLAR